jgi:hypothetical protein
VRDSNPAEIVGPSACIAFRHEFGGIVHECLYRMDNGRMTVIVDSASETADLNGFPAGTSRQRSCAGTPGGCVVSIAPQSEPVQSERPITNRTLGSGGQQTSAERSSEPLIASVLPHPRRVLHGETVPADGGSPTAGSYPPIQYSLRAHLRIKARLTHVTESCRWRDLLSCATAGRIWQ